MRESWQDDKCTNCDPFLTRAKHKCTKRILKASGSKYWSGVYRCIFLKFSRHRIHSLLNMEQKDDREI